MLSRLARAASEVGWAAMRVDDTKLRPNAPEAGRAKSVALVRWGARALRLSTDKASGKATSETTGKQRRLSSSRL